MRQLQDQLDAANAALKKQSDDEKGMVKRPVFRVSFNTADHQVEGHSHRGGFEPYYGMGTTPEGTLVPHTNYSSMGLDPNTTRYASHNSYAPVLDFLSNELGLMEEEAGDCTYIPVYSRVDFFQSQPNKFYFFRICRSSQVTTPDVGVT